ncbi:hypothetical protein NQZ68_025134 [Dissostichus eleginoides]|nr:hypothetical protein NQZ68_025134 [Dissostichus eleginoides]
MGQSSEKLGKALRISGQILCTPAYAAEHLAEPLANIRPEGGPSALEASCIPQPQQLTTHLSTFMRVSSSSQPAAHLLYPPVIQDHRPHTEAKGGGREEMGNRE